MIDFSTQVLWTPSEFENDFELPKMVLYVAMKNAAEGWSPLSWDTKSLREVRNLKKF